MPYSYRQRPIGSCQPRRPLRAADTGQNIANAIALYERPVHVHRGPEPMRQGEAEELDPYPWPWVRLDTSVGVPTKLDEAIVWITHLKGSIDITMNLIGCTYAKNIGDVDAATIPSFAPVTITAELKQYVNGSTTPAVLASATLNTTIRCLPVNTTPAGRYPMLKLIDIGWKANGPGATYKKDLMQIIAGARYGQFYPPDLALFQPTRLTIDYGDTGWTPDFDTCAENPAFVTITCVKAAGKEVVWDPSIVNGFRNWRSDEFVRIFNVGSAMWDRGRL